MAGRQIDAAEAVAAFQTKALTLGNHAADVVRSIRSELTDTAQLIERRLGLGDGESFSGIAQDVANLAGHLHDYLIQLRYYLVRANEAREAADALEAQPTSAEIKPALWQTRDGDLAAILHVWEDEDNVAHILATNGMTLCGQHFAGRPDVKLTARITCGLDVVMAAAKASGYVHGHGTMLCAGCREELDTA